MGAAGWSEGYASTGRQLQWSGAAERPGCRVMRGFDPVLHGRGLWLCRVREREICAPHTCGAGHARGGRQAQSSEESEQASGLVWERPVALPCEGEKTPCSATDVGEDVASSSECEAQKVWSCGIKSRVFFGGRPVTWKTARGAGGGGGGVQAVGKRKGLRQRNRVTGFRAPPGRAPRL